METAAGGLAPSQSEFDVRQRPASATGGGPSKKRSRWPEWCALSAYAALVAFAIPFHEPFADEAQAWQLARSLSLASLFKTYIRYEGSPGLWHFLLWILIRIHVSYTGIHWICGGIAVAATALLIFKSPFPRYLKLTLPFTVFLVYQYAVVARNYALAPILLYLVALCWKRSPLILALLLGLLANVSLHASVMSGGLAIVYLVEQVRHGSAKDPRRWRQLLPGAVILLALWAFAIWTAWPPRDFLKSLIGLPAHIPATDLTRSCGIAGVGNVLPLDTLRRLLGCHRPLPSRATQPPLPFAGAIFCHPGRDRRSYLVACWPPDSAHPLPFLDYMAGSRGQSFPARNLWPNCPRGHDHHADSMVVLCH